jgi:hypothetical protein
MRRATMLSNVPNVTEESPPVVLKPVKGLFVLI